MVSIVSGDVTTPHQSRASGLGEFSNQRFRTRGVGAGTTRKPRRGKTAGAKFSARDQGAGGLPRFQSMVATMMTSTIPNMIPILMWPRLESDMIPQTQFPHEAHWQ